MVRKRVIRLIDDVVKRVGLSDEQRELLHDAIHGRRLTHQEILQEAKDIKRDYPKLN